MSVDNGIFPLNDLTKKLIQKSCLCLAKNIIGKVYWLWKHNKALDEKFSIYINNFKTQNLTQNFH